MKYLYLPFYSNSLYITVIFSQFEEMEEMPFRGSPYFEYEGSSRDAPSSVNLPDVPFLEVPFLSLLLFK